MKRIFFTLLLACIYILSFAQEADTCYWKRGGSFSTNFTQVSFTNWAAGGQNSIAGVAKLNYAANYSKDKVAWDNTIDLGYGLSKVQGLALQKSEDIIDLSSKLGIKATDKWFYSGSVSFLSQFAPGYSDETNTTIISNLFAPAYLNIALGMDYKPNDNFSLALAPLTEKITMVFDEDIDETTYGLDADAKTRFELGASVTAKANATLMENVNLSTELDLFSNYLDNPQNIDVDWKVTLAMKVNKYLSVQIDTRLLYDADILSDDGTAKVQFKELLGIGLSFTL